jgi:hypothetical protein
MRVPLKYVGIEFDDTLEITDPRSQGTLSY